MNQAGDRRVFWWIVRVLVVFGVAGAFFGAEFDLHVLLGAKARAGAGKFLHDCWPPRTDGEFLTLLARRTVETLAMAFLGTSLAVVVGLPLGALSSRMVAYGATFASGETRPGAAARTVFWTARVVCAAFRSIPEIVWALLFVRVTGLGALPAVLAFGVAYGGLIGKVFSEQIEDVASKPVAALEAAGAGRVAALAWGVLPQSFGSMTAYAAYRFECAVRASVLMGFVGAGGLGQELSVSYGDYLYGEVLTETAFLVVLVALIERGSDALRRWTA